MAKVDYPGGSVEIDDDGFLTSPESWNDEVARALAVREGIDTLNPEMLEVIRFLRSYHQKFKAFPILSYVCKNVNQPRQCVSEEFINPEKAWKIAGLPKMEGIQFVSVDGKNFRLEECC